MILPSPRLAFLLLLPGVAAVVFPSRSLATAVGVFDVLLLLMVFVDVRASVRPSQIRVRRTTGLRLSLGTFQPVGWDVANEASQPVTLTITEDCDEPIERKGLPVTVTLRPRSDEAVAWRARPVRRGLWKFGDIHLRWPTRLGLCIRQKRIAAEHEVRVYPAVRNLGRYRLMLRQHRRGMAGLAASRARGRGGSFESLRDYVPGDDLADVSWKASAHRGRLTTRNYESERSQNIVILLDCGRLMTTEVERMTRLDYAINAALLLAWVAVKQGDSVGLVAFSDRIESWMPLTRGRGAISRMNDALYRLEPRLVESDYDRACRFLALQQRKRSLLVFLTDVIDSEVSAPLVGHTLRFARTHLPLCVTMRNLEVEATAEATPEHERDCFRRGVALDLLEKRETALAAMRRGGVDTLDAHPLSLSPDLLERYLSLKLRRRL